MAMNQIDLEACLARLQHAKPAKTVKKIEDVPEIGIEMPAMGKYPFDPIKRAADIEKLVMNGEDRKCYRFRHDTRFTCPCTVDSTGCPLDCGFCWNAGRNASLPGSFMSPSHIADKLNEMGKRYKDGNYRYGGCEPILGTSSVKHLAKVISLCDCDKFEIDTNGLMIGENPALLEYLFPYRDIILLRISAKGITPHDFELVTGAEGKYFNSPFTAIWKAAMRGFKCEMAYMSDFVDLKELDRVSEWIGPYDNERLTYYPGTKQRLVERKLWDLRIKR